ncbi:type II toxin-antitoxin system RelE/ParE family toxin [Granulicella rosea]|uniref:type II toxin-antitoxin system RelE/ParE family toxin n=1 Tax=Granulicella rosea TaxID=474952 RepID=UPI001C3E151B|nr:type II toxin-antitoxin system RelE/ParE family toxin [Granulicella rosea]
MPKRFGVRPTLSPAARADIRQILTWSREKFGQAAGARYGELLIQAFHDIAEDPERPGSQARPELAVRGVRTYHLSLSRSRVAGDRVKAPRHFVLYRYRPGSIEIGRILHDSRDLARHLPEGYGVGNPGESEEG